MATMTSKSAKAAPAKESAVSMPAPRLSAAMSSLRDQTRLVMILGLSCLVLTIALTIALIFVFRTHREVIAATESGRMIPVVPLDIPYVSDARVVGFVDECTRATFNHDFMHWRTTLTEAKKCFTNFGADTLTASLAPWTEDIVKRELVMTVSLTDVPVIVKRAPDRGLYSWKVQAPIELFRRGTRVVDAPKPFLLEVVVRRVGLDENPRGIAIDSLTLLPDVAHN